MLEAAGAERLELWDGRRNSAAAAQEFLGGPRSRPKRGAVPEWRLVARLRPLREFRIGAVFERQVRCRGCGSKPDRDWVRTQPSAFLGSRGGGKESVRCRAVLSLGPSHRQRLVLGIGGGRWALFGDKEWRCGTASTPSMERAAGGGAWIPSWRLVRDQARWTHSIEGTGLQLNVGDW